MTKKTKMKTDEIIKATYSAVVSILSPGRTKEKLPKKESSKHPEIYVFRHGETYDNQNRIFSGHRDSKMTDRGKQQVAVLNKKLSNKEINVCITSSLFRAKKTAKIALIGHNVSFEVDDRIIERNYGDLTGTSKTKLMKENLVNAVKFRRFYDAAPPNGESLKVVSQRVFPFCRDLVKRIRRTGENIAISCHGNSMKIIRLFFEKLKPIDVIGQENPLGEDYAEYVVTPTKVLVAKTPEDKKS